MEPRPDDLVCQRECSGEGAEALFLCERCIFLLSTGMAASASPWPPHLTPPSLHLCFCITPAVSLSLTSLFLPSVLSGAVQRTEWVYYFYEVFFHAVILKVHFCSRVHCKSETFFLHLQSTTESFPTAWIFPYPFSLSLFLLHTHTQSTQTRCPPLLSSSGHGCLLKLTLDSLRPTVHSSGRDLHLIWIRLWL